MTNIFKRTKRIILCGASCAGKNFIRQRFLEKGYYCDVSYTSREPREGEIEGVDYRFITKKQFENRIKNNGFYEYVEYEGNYYGTGKNEWGHSQVFIMETDGINKIKQKDRKNCLIIYVNTPFDVRLKRMRARGWSSDKIWGRSKIDDVKFKNFTNYDLEISSMTENEFNY